MQRQKNSPEWDGIGRAPRRGWVGEAIPGLSGERRRASPFKSGSRNRQLDELVRILDARPQQFRLQFFAPASERGPTIVQETVLEAPDAEGAARAAAALTWPPRAIGLRLLDRDGREVFERLKADLQ